MASDLLLNRASCRRKESTKHFGRLAIELLNVAFVAASIGAHAQAQTSFVNPDNGHTYVVLPNDETFQAARANAAQMGGYLATVGSQSEQDWIATVVIPAVPGVQLWIGLSDEIQEGVFVWDDGEPFTFSAWCPGEPNNQGNEDYVAMGMCSNAGWNDLPAGGSCCVSTVGLVEIPQLVLTAVPDFPTQGITLSLTTTNGSPSNPMLLFAVKINGTPTLGFIAIGTFDVAGSLTVSGTVPPGLAGVNVEFQSFGIAINGQADHSNRELVSFQ